MPAICYWNVSTLTLREEFESNSGGFGMGELQQPFVPTNQNEQDDVATHYSGEETNDDEIHHTAQHDTAESCIQTIEHMYEKIICSTKTLDEMINESTHKFPENTIIADCKIKVQDLLPKEVQNHGDATDDLNESPTTQCWKENASQIEHSLMLATTHAEHSFNTPVPRYKVVMSKPLSDMMNASSKKIVDESPLGKIPSPISLSVYQPKDDQNVGNRRSKRNITKPNICRSPFIVRPVPINNGISNDDKLLSDWIFSTQGELKLRNSNILYTQFSLS